MKCSLNTTVCGLILGAVGLGASTGCSDDGENDRDNTVAAACTAGAVQWCACPDRPTPGTQVCGVDGDTWSACDCTTSTTQGCRSNSECAFPRNLCDVASGTCVECLASSDCTAKPGTVCSQAACVCPVATDSFCAAAGTSPARCVDLTRSTADCGTCDHSCFGACAAGDCVDPWEPLTAAGAPSPRTLHVAVSTGSTMIVWGGRNGTALLADGAIYDPTLRAWTPMSGANAPSPREQATAVWTGSRMLVWGGRDQAGTPLGDGKEYDPIANSWSNLPSANAPSARYQHTAIWNGGRLYLWGGFDDSTELATGASYSVDGGWTPLSAGPHPRRLHTAVWDLTNDVMLVFGGLGYDPNTGTTTSLNSGGRLTVAGTWTQLPMMNVPASRYEHVAVWAGTKMFVWGGYNYALGLLADGAQFDDAVAWLPLAGMPPSPRRRASAVYVAGADAVVVWGGYGAGGRVLGDGGVFEVANASWRNTGLPTGPSATVDHTAVVVNDRVLYFGGTTSSGGATNIGAQLDLAKLP